MERLCVCRAFFIAKYVLNCWFSYCYMLSSTQNLPNNPYRNRVPVAALDYCYNLWQQHQFSFKVTTNRKTKLGDFRTDGKQLLQVTVNYNLHPCQFLITYLHEVAHVITWKQYGRKAQAHGQEWKRNFSQLLAPILNLNCFPEDVLQPLKAYATNPSATLSSAPSLCLALQKYSTGLSPEATPLLQLKAGDTFTFQNIQYKHLGKRRTRILCEQLATGKKYLIPQIAAVEVV